MVAGEVAGDFALWKGVLARRCEEGGRVEVGRVGQTRGSLDDEFEALVQFVLDLLAVLEVFVRMFFEITKLFFAVCGEVSH